MAEVRLSAKQASAVALWTVEGCEFVSLNLYDQPPPYARGWRAGDILVTQGDAYVHIGVDGRVKDSVPYLAAGFG